MLNVDLSIRDGDGLGVVALRGEFELVDVPRVASHLITAVAVCGPSVIVDLAALEGICYSGLAVLLRIRKWTRASGGDLPLAAPQPPVRRVLEATYLIDVFSVYPGVEEAAGGVRQLRSRPSAAPQRLYAAMVPRCGSRRPVCRGAHHLLARPLRQCRLACAYQVLGLGRLEVGESDRGRPVVTDGLVGRLFGGVSDGSPAFDDAGAGAVADGVEVLFPGHLGHRAGQEAVSLPRGERPGRRPGGRCGRPW
jgi:anti-anti-sigma factor